MIKIRIESKKYKYKDGKREEREETDLERRDRLFGTEELSRLSKGIYEDEEDDTSNDKDTVILNRFAELMTDDVSLQEAAKKKSLMPFCHDGNPYREPAVAAGGNPSTAGQYTSRGKAGSVSSRKPKTGKGCKSGVARMKGGKELFTKTDCGRYGDNLCSTGKPRNIKEDEIIEDGFSSRDIRQLEAYLKGIIAREIRSAIQSTRAAAGCNFSQLVKAQQAWSQASDSKSK